MFQCDAVDTSPDLGGQNVLITFKVMTVRHNMITSGRHERTYREFSVAGFILTYVQKSWLSSAGGAIPAHRMPCGTAPGPHSPASRIFCIGHCLDYNHTRQRGVTNAQKPLAYTRTPDNCLIVHSGRWVCKNVGDRAGFKGRRNRGFRRFNEPGPKARGGPHRHSTLIPVKFSGSW